jgi:hypothetical protein
MHRRGHPGDLVDHQDRGAVGNQNCQRKVSLRCHQGVNPGGFALPGAVHDGDLAAVALAHEQEMVSLHVKRAGDQPTVGLDRGGIIAHMSAEVEAGEVPHT